MINILVTGGLGHIGTSLLAILNKNNQFKIHVIDNNIGNNDVSYITSLFPKINFIHKNLCKVDLDELLTGIDVVFHLAATVNAIEHINDATSVYDNNTNLTSLLVNACVKNKVKEFIFMSTASVYGPTPETWKEKIRTAKDTRLFPQTPYAESKLEAEKIISKHAYDFESVKIFRAGTVYGMSPGVRYHTAINQFVKNAVTSKPITIWSPGNGIRPYIHVDHIAKILYDAMLINSKKYTIEINNAVDVHWSPLDILKIISKVVPNVEVNKVVPRIINQDAYEIYQDINYNYEVNSETLLIEYIKNVAKMFGKLYENTN